MARHAGELLDIKQAASMLNVSEISLRRWTDSGKLPCVRIGGKRERRFRKDDLLAFLEGGSSAPGASAAEARGGRVTRVLLEGIAIDYGSHLCALYESDLGRLKLAVPFLADGLRSGDVCYLVAAPESQAAILSHLKEVYDGFDATLARDQLVVSDGMPGAREMYEYFEHSFVMATRAGNQALRVLGDMAWFLTRGMGLAELVEFELRYNHSLAHRFPVVSLCQYDARVFSGTAVLAALRCHEDTFRYPLSRFLGV